MSAPSPGFRRLSALNERARGAEPGKVVILLARIRDPRRDSMNQPSRIPTDERVIQALRAAPPSIEQGASLRAACRAMRYCGSAEILVLRPGGNCSLLSDIAGIITHSDIVKAAAAGLRLDKTHASDVASAPLVTIEAGASIDQALFELRRRRIHRLIVTRDRHLAGLLTIDSLLEAQNARLDRLEVATRRLESEATHDPLTHLANRRVFDDALSREFARCQREGRSLGLLMIDIDHFKRINDEFGHQRGDAILRQLSARLQASVRRSDLLARYGGEEFAVVASTPGREELEVLAEKLRKVVQDEPFGRAGAGSLAPVQGLGGPGWRPLTLTISIGAAIASPQSRTSRDSPEDLLAAADAALYRAKRGGRNCIRFAGDP